MFFHSSTAAPLLKGKCAAGKRVLRNRACGALALHSHCTRIALAFNSHCTCIALAFNSHSTHIALALLRENAWLASGEPKYLRKIKTMLQLASLWAFVFSTAVFARPPPSCAGLLLRHLPVRLPHPLLVVVVLVVFYT